MKTADRRAELLDTLERTLNRRREGVRLSFPSIGTRQTDELGVWPLVKFTLRFSLIHSLLFVLLILIAQVMVSTIFGGFFLPQYQFHPFDLNEVILIIRMLLHLDLTTPAALFVPLFYCLATFTLWFPTRWAWNRRADRLSHAASRPQAQPLLAVDAGVWPPPPAAPEGR